MRTVKLGSISYTSDSQSPAFKVAVKDTISRIFLRLTGNVVVTGALTLTEDSILRLLQKIRVQIGGKDVKSYGLNNAIAAAGKRLYYANQYYYGVLPTLNEPAVGVATNPFDVMLTIPFALPPRLQENQPTAILDANTGQIAGAGAKETFSLNGRMASCLSPQDNEIEIVVDWGTHTDLYSAGTATGLTNCELEVIAELVPALNGIQMPYLWHQIDKNAELSAAASSEQETDLDKKGVCPWIDLLCFDNSLRADDVFNNLQVMVNGTYRAFYASFGAAKADLKQAGGLQATALPTGVNAIIFDKEENGEGGLVLDSGAISEAKFILDQDALTGTYYMILGQNQLRRQNA